MRRTSMRWVVSLTTASLIALLAAGVVSAKNSQSTRVASEGRVLSATIVPDLTPKTEPTIAGIAPGGAPWALAAGHVNIAGNGLIEASVEGLLLGPGAPPNLVGTTGPVKQVVASVVCANGSIVTTNAVALSKEGNASIHQVVALSSPCVGPVVLVRAFFSGAPGPWLAVSGF
ncbi:MAG TPA: hypothetical protein VJN88_12750 [Ktedonobacterales bacterium]|nr:hypothetical protein [Ktedonobacterales bacterium]